MGLLVSETSLKEANEGRDAAEVDVVKSTISRDSVSPHQILHTEIIEGFVEREVGTGVFKDTLRGGIWSPAVPNVTPGTGGSPPDLGIGVDATLMRRRSTIVPTRYTGVVAFVLMGIGLSGVVGHLVVSDEGDDGIIPQTTIPYNLPLGPRRQHICQRTLWPMEFGHGNLVRS